MPRWPRFPPQPRSSSLTGWTTRAHRKSEEHLDAFLAVSGVRELHDEFVRRGASILKPLEQRPWGQRDFYVEDPDGYILCFSEAV